jgi:GNAT superfamily N-acetyltransferase
LLVVAERNGAIVGTLQLSYLPGLARKGALRGQIEAVRIAKDRRGGKLGEAMFAWAIDECRARGCTLLQLTTDKAWPDAPRFYDRLGFEPTHVGYDLKL